MRFDSNDFDTVSVLVIRSLLFKSFFTSGARTNFVAVFLIFNINGLHYGLLYLHGQLYCIFALKIVGWKLKAVTMVSKLQSE